MTEEPAGDGGHFGTWTRDGAGLPAFDLDASAHGDMWHQIGNDRLTATAHADGHVTLWWSEYGQVRLGTIVGDLHRADGTRLLAAPERVQWEVGGAAWTWTAGTTRVTRRVWVPFGDVPGLRIDVSVEGAPDDAEYVEACEFEPYPVVLGGLMSPRTDAPAGLDTIARLRWHTIYTLTGASRAATEVMRRVLGARLTLHDSLDPAVGAVVLSSGQSRPSRPSVLASLPDPIVVAPLAAPGVQTTTTSHRTRTEVQFVAAPAAEMSFGVGVAAGEVDPAALVDSLAGADPSESAASWTAVCSLEMDAAPALAREATWHGAMLRSAQVRDATFGLRYCPQGSAYGFVHGLQGAPRDYALFAVPLTLVDPAGAADLIRVMLHMTRPDGAIQYAHWGAGSVTGAGIHPYPSDLPLWLLWALTEHVWMTGDTALLDDAAPKARAAWRRLRDHTGRGPHGLVRVGSGDWSDPISAMVPDRKAFHRDGESTFNTAMALHVLPRAARLLGDPEMADYAAELASALSDAWTGRWFLRGYDGRGGPVGADHLFLDANAWCLIAGDAIPLERRRALAAQIAQRCLAPSPIGPTVLDRPHHVRLGILPPGWDVNGGVWAAISALTAWGLAGVDPELAWRCLEAQTFARHAQAYPDIWYGIWSGPDAYNSHLGDRAGETFVQPATPMTEFPVMNANAHSGPLLAIMRTLGIEADEDSGLVVRERPAAGAPAQWRWRTALGTLTPAGLTPAGQ